MKSLVEYQRAGETLTSEQQEMLIAARQFCPESIFEPQKRHPLYSGRDDYKLRGLEALGREYEEEMSRSSVGAAGDEYDYDRHMSLKSQYEKLGRELAEIDKKKVKAAADFDRRKLAHAAAVQIIPGTHVKIVDPNSIIPESIGGKFKHEHDPRTQIPSATLMLEKKLRESLNAKAPRELIVGYCKQVLPPATFATLPVEKLKIPPPPLVLKPWPFNARIDAFVSLFNQLEDIAKQDFASKWGLQDQSTCPMCKNSEGRNRPNPCFLKHSDPKSEPQPEPYPRLQEIHLTPEEALENQARVKKNTAMLASMGLEPQSLNRKVYVPLTKLMANTIVTLYSSEADVINGKHFGHAFVVVTPNYEGIYTNKHHAINKSDPTMAGYFTCWGITAVSTQPTKLYFSPMNIKNKFLDLVRADRPSHWPGIDIQPTKPFSTLVKSGEVILIGTHGNTSETTRDVANRLVLNFSPGIYLGTERIDESARRCAESGTNIPTDIYSNVTVAGMSGAPVFNAQGDIAGMHSFGHQTTDHNHFLNKDEIVLAMREHSIANMADGKSGVNEIERPPIVPPKN
jgi:hypothetical protein